MWRSGQITLQSPVSAISASRRPTFDAVNALYLTVGMLTPTVRVILSAALWYLILRRWSGRVSRGGRRRSTESRVPAADQTGRPGTRRRYPYPYMLPQSRQGSQLTITRPSVRQRCASCIKELVVAALPPATAFLGTSPRSFFCAFSLLSLAAPVGGVSSSSSLHLTK